MIKTNELSKKKHELWWSDWIMLVVTVTVVLVLPYSVHSPTIYSHSESDSVTGLDHEVHSLQVQDFNESIFLHPLALAAWVCQLLSVTLTHTQSVALSLTPWSLTNPSSCLNSIANAKIWRIIIYIDLMLSCTLYLPEPCASRKE